MNVFQAGMGLFPVAVLLILYWSGRRDRTVSTDDWLYGCVLLSTAAVTALSALRRLLDGAAFAWADYLGWTVGIGYLVGASLLPLLWFTYLYGMMSAGDNLFLQRGKLAVFALPSLAGALLALCSPWTGWVFRLGANNRYLRGPLFFAPYACAGIYAVLCAVVCLRARGGTACRARKRQDRALLLLLPAACLGHAAQIPWPGLWIGWPLTAATLAAVSLTVRNRRITTDALTGLNNRRELERYAGARLKARDASRPWCLMIVDVDHFKSINDRFGHMAGDRALCCAADALRDAFGGEGAFLARIGGDEFAVVADCDGEERARELERRLHEAAARARGAPCAIGLSVGVALYGGEDVPGLDWLIERADKVMYAQKKRKHGRQR